MYAGCDVLLTGVALLSYGFLIALTGVCCADSRLLSWYVHVVCLVHFHLQLFVDKWLFCICMCFFVCIHVTFLFRLQVAFCFVNRCFFSLTRGFFFACG